MSLRELKKLSTSYWARRVHGGMTQTAVVVVNDVDIFPPRFIVNERANINSRGYRISPFTRICRNSPAEVSTRLDSNKAPKDTRGFTWRLLPLASDVKDMELRPDKEVFPQIIILRLSFPRDMIVALYLQEPYRVGPVDAYHGIGTPNPLGNPLCTPPEPAQSPVKADSQTDGEDATQTPLGLPRSTPQEDSDCD
ncbi:hypothetical protein P170DRAFT_478673 [Aspergillus steynii IBT 23096]|uniref:Uncharacterized protein n=1 Tax=Aspergillus steynii IBT 23096 TaxID=1392250 RepID=A0A2I2FYM9_9EURO|nr:uncharacterized protein P170DRAFT_478673 [Aspergillus steynii IBT 23096]PLB45735.1 hypothetical protein P170DRAFT_478673 [Aspergillus steynii IBT 23096]